MLLYYPVLFLVSLVVYSPLYSVCRFSLLVIAFLYPLVCVSYIRVY